MLDDICNDLSDRVLTATMNESKDVNDCFDEPLANRIVTICSVSPQFGLLLTQRTAMKLAFKLAQVGITQEMDAFHEAMVRMLMSIIMISTSTLGGVKFAENAMMEYLAEVPAPEEINKDVFGGLDFDLKWNDDLDK